MYLSDRIKAYRKENNLTLQEFADRCDLSKGYISMLENEFKPNSTGKQVSPSLNVLTKLAKGMNCDLSLLVSDETAQSPIEDTTSEFDNAEDAMVYIIKNPIMMAYGGYDIEKMPDEELIKFANQTVNYIKFITSQYKK